MIDDGQVVLWRAGPGRAWFRLACTFAGLAVRRRRWLVVAGIEVGWGCGTTLARRAGRAGLRRHRCGRHRGHGRVSAC